MGHAFVDEVEITVSSGDGGAGCVAFRREKYVPFGGPNGGDGGRGGDVWFEVDPQLQTLLDCRYRPIRHAGHGEAGSTCQRHGKDGDVLLLKVPRGTMVYDSQTMVKLVDLQENGQRYLVAKGGRGGKGNEFFKNSTRQAPDFAQPGEPGETLHLRLELKLLADVGLIGLPNVGKSSLIARMSACQPKIANYPFTTLVPNLGVVRLSGWQDFVMADVPGLIPGAHTGLGLGIRFLKHVERVKILAHVITVDPAEPDKDVLFDIEAILKELEAYEPALLRVKQVWLVNQCDRLEVQEQFPKILAYAKKRGVPCLAVSALAGIGIAEIKALLGRMLDEERQAEGLVEAS